MNTEACEPTATRDGTTPSKVAAYPRARSTSAVYSITSTVPVAYVSTSRRSAATVTSAGSPSVAAPRYPRPAANRSLTSSPMPPSFAPRLAPRDSPLRNGCSGVRNDNHFVGDYPEGGLSEGGDSLVP